MKTILARIKNWQIFLLLILPIPLILLTSILFHYGDNGTIPSLYFILFILFFVVLASFIPFLIFFLWFGSVGNLLYLKVSKFIENTEFKIFNFSKIILIFWEILYSLNVFYTYFLIFYFYFKLGTEQELLETFHFSIFSIIFTIHLFVIFLAIICLIYSIYFAAKIIKIAEENRKVRFGEYFSYIIAIVFFPIGIWFLQPKINKLGK